MSSSTLQTGTSWLLDPMTTLLTSTPCPNATSGLDNALETLASSPIWTGHRIANTFKPTVELLRDCFSRFQVSFPSISIELASEAGILHSLFTSGGKQLTNKEEIRNIHWATWTGVLGPEANGIWEKYTDTNDINATDANFGSEVIVTGDDFGLVKLFTFPSLKKGSHLTLF